MGSASSGTAARWSTGPRRPTPGQLDPAYADDVRRPAPTTPGPRGVVLLPGAEGARDRAQLLTDEPVEVVDDLARARAPQHGLGRRLRRRPSAARSTDPASRRMPGGSRSRTAGAGSSRRSTGSSRRPGRRRRARRSRHGVDPAPAALSGEPPDLDRWAGLDLPDADRRLIVSPGVHADALDRNVASGAAVAGGRRHRAARFRSVGGGDDRRRLRREQRDGRRTAAPPSCWPWCCFRWRRPCCCSRCRGSRAVGAGFVGGLSGGSLLGAVGAPASSSGPPASPSDEFGAGCPRRTRRRPSMVTMGINDVEDRAPPTTCTRSQRRTGGTVPPDVHRAHRLLQRASPS